MRLLCLHVNSISYEATEKAFGAAEDTDQLSGRAEEALAVFTAVEDRDESDPDDVIDRAVEEISEVAEQVNMETVVLYPYVHLTASPGSPETAMRVLDGIEDSLSHDTKRSPFGWYKSFTVDVKGHPLAELSREFGPTTKDATSEAFIFNDRDLTGEERAALSTSLLIGRAVCELYSDARLGAVDLHGKESYVDVDGVDLDMSDMDRVSERVQQYIEDGLRIERGGSLRGLQEEIADDTGVRSAYSVDGTAVAPLYEDPFVGDASEIGAFDILHLSSAHWRGNEENEQLDRIHSVGFTTEEALREFEEQRRRAQERDHTKIGEEMNLFSISKRGGPGLPLYHPPGKTVLQKLQEFMDNLNVKNGYRRVETPHLFKADLWKQSGHYEAYRDDMFLFENDGEEFGLKAMNCPGHAKIYENSGNWSYKDLPVRYFENGKVYRKEQKGELSGLSRVWAFTIDDGHLFVRKDQIEEEIRSILQMIEHVTDTVGIETEYYLATKPDDAIGGDAIWERSEDALEAVLEEEELDFEVEDGDGAFYGPKIDVGLEDALGRDWDGPTVQLDFNMPERFDLTFKGEDNEDHRPVMIHRALYGSYERFFMVLIEQYEGRFPTWLAPEQVRILPVSDDNVGFAETVKEELDAFRTTVESRSLTVGKKISTAHKDRVPYMVIVGDDEEADGSIAVRDREEREDRGISLDSFKQHLAGEVDEKRLRPDFFD